MVHEKRKREEGEGVQRRSKGKVREKRSGRRKRHQENILERKKRDGVDGGAPGEQVSAEAEGVELVRQCCAAMTNR